MAKPVRGAELTKLIKLYMRGMSFREIATKTGRSLHTINAVVKREGLKEMREEVQRLALEKIPETEAEALANDFRNIGTFLDRLWKALEGRDLGQEQTRDVVKWVLEGMKSRREIFSKPSTQVNIQINQGIVVALEEYEKLSPEDREKLRGGE